MRRRAQSALVQEKQLIGRCFRYFEGGVSSAYLWSPEDDKDKFAGVVLLKKGEEPPPAGCALQR